MRTTCDGRVLVCGPVLPPYRVNGMQDVLTDLVDGLRSHGWEVDTLLWPSPAADLSPTCPPHSRTSALAATVAAALRLPDGLRLAARILVHDRKRAGEDSALLAAIESRVRSGSYTAVLACLQTAPTGVAALVTRLHPGAILLSMSDLAREVRRGRALTLACGVTRWFGGSDLHPDVYRPVDPDRVSMAVFASDAWRDAAIAAGVPSSVTRVIHFGVPCPPTLPPIRPVRQPARLLWGGRLCAQKGLHLYLPAVAALADEMAIRLTIVPGEGDTAYRRQIDRTIRRLRLTPLVTYREPVERDDLPALLSDHDALLFFSVYRQPVAQMLLHAFAHGLVVVGPESPDPHSTLRRDRTALCFAAPRPHLIAEAIRRAVTDDAARRRVRLGAFELVRAEHSLDGTRAAYERLLRSETVALRTSIV